MTTTDARKASLGGGIALGIWIVAFNFLFDGCGFSRVASYYDHYDGSAGFSHSAIVGRVAAIGEPVRTSLRNLHYGSMLKGQKSLELEISRAEVPPSDVEAVFIDESLLPAVKPGAEYCFHVSHVGNYYSFLFKSRYGFSVYKVHDARAPKHQISTSDPRWALPYKLYSLCVLLLPILFLMAALRLIDSDGKPRQQISVISALWPVFLYAAAAGYIAKLDWVDRIRPIGKTLFLCILIGLAVWVWRRQSDTQRS